MRLCSLFVLLFAHSLAIASDRLSILDFPFGGTKVDRSGKADSSQALANVIAAANERTVRGEPACVYIPPGVYRIVTPPPMFKGAGCLVGDGPSQSTIVLDSSFGGDLFSWSEAWIVTTPGPSIVGIKIKGVKGATAIQNAFVFYDRNDQVFMDNVDVWDVHGRALYSGVSKSAPQAYMRESHFRSLRFFGDGAPGVPVVEFNSQGTGSVDATNEIRISQIDIYGSAGPSLVFRNGGSGVIRDITVDSLRIEGTENGSTEADLLTIGDPAMRGGVNNLYFSNAELLDPYRGYAALRLTAPNGAPAPYQIMFEGSIGGGVAHGQGLRIDAGRSSTFRLIGMHTEATNVVIGKGVSQIVLDAAGQEAGWTFEIDESSRGAVRVPAYQAFSPQKNR